MSLPIRFRLRTFYCLGYWFPLLYILSLYNVVTLNSQLCNHCRNLYGGNSSSYSIDKDSQKTRTNDDVSSAITSAYNENRRLGVWDPESLFYYSDPMTHSDAHLHKKAIERRLDIRNSEEGNSISRTLSKKSSEKESTEALRAEETNHESNTKNRGTFWSWLGYGDGGDKQKETTDGNFPEHEREKRHDRQHEEKSMHQENNGGQETFLSWLGFRGQRIEEESNDNQTTDEQPIIDARKIRHEEDDSNSGLEWESAEGDVRTNEEKHRHHENNKGQETFLSLLGFNGQRIEEQENANQKREDGELINYETINRHQDYDGGTATFLSYLGLDKGLDENSDHEQNTYFSSFGYGGQQQQKVKEECKTIKLVDMPNFTKLKPLVFIFNRVSSLAMFLSNAFSRPLKLRNVTLKLKFLRTRFHVENLKLGDFSSIKVTPLIDRTSNTLSIKVDLSKHFTMNFDLIHRPTGFQRHVKAILTNLTVYAKLDVSVYKRHGILRNLWDGFVNEVKKFIYIFWNKNNKSTEKLSHFFTRSIHYIRIISLIPKYDHLENEITAKDPGAIATMNSNTIQYIVNQKEFMKTVISFIIQLRIKRKLNKKIAKRVALFAGSRECRADLQNK